MVRHPLDRTLISVQGPWFSQSHHMKVWATEVVRCIEKAAVDQYARYAVSYLKELVAFKDWSGCIRFIHSKPQSEATVTCR